MMQVLGMRLSEKVKLFVCGLGDDAGLGSGQVLAPQPRDTVRIED